MEKSYKVISSFGLGDIFIHHFKTLEAADDAYKKDCLHECEFAYLLETVVRYSGSGDSANKILKSHKRQS